MYKILAGVKWKPDTKIHGDDDEHTPSVKSHPRGSYLEYASKPRPTDIRYTRPDQLVNNKIVKETVKAGNGKEPQQLPKRKGYIPNPLARMAGHFPLKPTEEIPLPLRFKGNSMSDRKEQIQTLQLSRLRDIVPTRD